MYQTAMETAVKREWQEKIQKVLTPCDDSSSMRLELVSFQEGVLEVRLLGSCRHCFAAQEAFEETVKRQILQLDPSIQEVVLNKEVSPEILDFARQLLRR